MVLRRGFRYRIYPTPEQVARLVAWEGALRALWNAAHEQRLLHLCRGARQPTAFDQITQLTELRAETPWLADVPRNVCAQLLVELDLAGQRWFKGLARRPRWKKKGRDPVAVTEPHPRGFRVTDRGVVFPALGEVRAGRQRAHALPVLSSRYAQSHGVVIVEKLNVAGMGRGGLGRQIQGAGWSMFVDLLRSKLEATGGTLVEVPAAYSSQTCSACGVVDAASRQGDRFRCVGCGHEAHADVNAARVLLRRRTDGGAGRGGQGAVGPPMKRQLRVVRRGHSALQVSGSSKSPGLQSG